MLNFILKILQSAKSQTRLIFFHLKITQLYIIFILYRLFSNHLKIIKIKDRRLCWISY